MLQRIAAVVFVSAFLAAQTAPPERKVEGSVLISERDPAVRIQLPQAVQYVGADRWLLYGMADCELHAFVGADPHKNVERLYWVQFEGYLPSRPDLHHTYDSPKHATIGGLDFYVDSWARATAAKTQAGSDFEHIMALVRAKGFHVPQAMMYLRLVHLLDEQKRKELMIIYAEDLGPAGFTAADLQPGGKDYARWPGIADALLERAKKRIEIKPAGS